MFKMLLFNFEFHWLTPVRYISKVVNWKEETQNVTGISQKVYLALCSAVKLCLALELLSANYSRDSLLPLINIWLSSN